MPKRKMNPNSLANLKLGRMPSDNMRMTFVIYPESQIYLSSQSNKSKTVNAALSYYERMQYGNTQSDNAFSTESDDLYTLQKQVDELSRELTQKDEIINRYRDKCRIQEDILSQVLEDNNKAAGLLQEALKFPANIGGKIKKAIRQALPLLDDEWDKTRQTQIKEVAKLYFQELKK